MIPPITDADTGSTASLRLIVTIVGPITTLDNAAATTSASTSESVGSQSAPASGESTPVTRPASLSHIEAAHAAEIATADVAKLKLERTAKIAQLAPTDGATDAVKAMASTLSNLDGMMKIPKLLADVSGPLCIPRS